MKLYKITDAHGETGGSYRTGGRYVNGCYRPGKSKALKWGDNVRHSIRSRVKKPKLCTAAVIHAFLHPLQARLHFTLVKDPALLWEAEGDVVVHDQAKVGVRSLTTLRQLQVASLKIGFDDAVFARKALSLLMVVEQMAPRTGSAPQQAMKQAILSNLAKGQLPDIVQLRGYLYRMQYNGTASNRIGAILNSGSLDGSWNLYPMRLLSPQRVAAIYELAHKALLIRRKGKAY